MSSHRDNHHRRPRDRLSRPAHPDHSDDYGSQADADYLLADDYQQTAPQYQRFAHHGGPQQGHAFAAYDRSALDFSSDQYPPSDSSFSSPPRTASFTTTAAPSLISRSGGRGMGSGEGAYARTDPGGSYEVGAVDFVRSDRPIHGQDSDYTNDDPELQLEGHRRPRIPSNLPGPAQTGHGRSGSLSGMGSHLDERQDTYGEVDHGARYEPGIFGNSFYDTSITTSPQPTLSDSMEMQIGSYHGSVDSYNDDPRYSGSRSSGRQDRFEYNRPRRDSFSSSRREGRDPLSASSPRRVFTQQISQRQMPYPPHTGAQYTSPGHAVGHIATPQAYQQLTYGYSPADPTGSVGTNQQIYAPQADYYDDQPQPQPDASEHDGQWGY